MTVIRPTKHSVLPTTTAKAPALSKTVSKNRVHASRFALGLFGALATSLLTWHSLEPALADYGDYAGYGNDSSYSDDSYGEGSYSEGAYSEGPYHESSYGEGSRNVVLSYEAINVFGDSLVDSGNFFNLTNAFSEEGVPALPPSPPYAKRFSNGSVWVENLSQILGHSVTSKSVLSQNNYNTADGRSINFAFGGALSSDVNISDGDFPAIASSLPGLQEQVNEFVALSNTAANKSQTPLGTNTLTVVSIGSNDYLAAVGAPESLGELPIEQLPEVVTDNIIDSIVQLSATGADEFLVVNIPPMGESPLADFFDAQSGQDVSSSLNQLSEAHNALLSQKLDNLSRSNPDINIIKMDLNTLFAEISANPSEFGLTNVTDACLTNFQPGFQFEGVCENPDQFIFWDDVHPTAATHQIIASHALEALIEDQQTASGPGPAYAMPFVLFGIVGTSALVKKGLS